jgi:hypothetical protein
MTHTRYALKCMVIVMVVIETQNYIKTFLNNHLFLPVPQNLQEYIFFFPSFRILIFSLSFHSFNFKIQNKKKKSKPSSKRVPDLIDFNEMSSEWTTLDGLFLPLFFFLFSLFIRLYYFIVISCLFDLCTYFSFFFIVIDKFLLFIAANNNAISKDMISNPFAHLNDGYVDVVVSRASNKALTRGSVSIFSLVEVELFVFICLFFRY